MTTKSWTAVADHLVGRLQSYAASRERNIGRVRFSLESVMDLYATNHVPSDGDWRELEAALRMRQYALIRPNAVSIAIFDTSTFDTWLKLGVQE